MESLPESLSVEPGPTVRADKRRVAANFSKAAATYDLAATLQERAAARAMLGLPAGYEPERILDMGSGTGLQTAQLAEHYPDACVLGMDLAMGMLSFSREQYSGLNSGLKWCSGDIEALPFQNDSFDIVFSSMAIQWCSLQKVLRETVSSTSTRRLVCLLNAGSRHYAGTATGLGRLWMSTPMSMALSLTRYRKILCNNQRSGFILLNSKPRRFITHRLFSF